MESVPDLAVGLKAKAAGRPARLADQGHGSLPRSAIGLADVAGQTSRGHILPAVAATPAAGNHMIDREGGAGTAAVLAGVIVAVKDIAPGQRYLPIGNPHELMQANHGGLEQIGTDRAGGIMLQPLGLSLEQHHHGPAPGRDVQRLVGRIENKNVTHAGFLDHSHAIGGRWMLRCSTTPIAARGVRHPVPA
jgi:hypothetical protein